MSNKTDRIRALNDRFRTSMSGGRVMLTHGFDALPSDVKAIAIRRIATFNVFDDDNDPHREHDFGIIEITGWPKLYWKIDYYDPSGEAGAEDPADDKATLRVMTIMRADEY